MKGLFKKQFDIPAEDEEEEGEGEEETGSRAMPLQAGHATIMRRDPRQSGGRDSGAKVPVQMVCTWQCYSFAYHVLYTHDPWQVVEMLRYDNCPSAYIYIALLSGCTRI